MIIKLILLILLGGLIFSQVGRLLMKGLLAWLFMVLCLVYTLTFLFDKVLRSILMKILFILFIFVSCKTFSGKQKDYIEMSSKRSDRNLERK